MAIPDNDKPLDALREQTIDRLVMNFGHGRLSMDAFQRRLDTAFEATDADALIRLSADLDLDVDTSYLERKQQRLGQFIEPGEEKDSETVATVLGGTDRGGQWTVPRELRIVTVLGGTDIDMSHARFASRTTRIKVFCLLGGVDIAVPESVNTTINVGCLLGGVDNNAPSSGKRDAPHLIVDGFVLLGGLDVKVRKSLRERVVAFADGLRAMFGR
jgi:hypothetical protein